MTLQGIRHAYELDRLGLNARCRIEEASGRSFEDVLRELAGRRRPAPQTAQVFLAALLVDPEHQASVSAVLKDIGGVPTIRRAAQAAWKAYRGTRARRRA